MKFYRIMKMKDKSKVYLSQVEDNLSRRNIVVLFKLLIYL